MEFVLGLYDKLICGSELMKCLVLIISYNNCIIVSQFNKLGFQIYVQAGFKSK